MIATQIRGRATPSELQQRYERHDKKFWDLDMRGLDLRGRQWLGTDFVNNDMRGVNLQGSELRFAALEGTNADGINLSGVDASFSRGISMSHPDAVSLVGINAIKLTMEYSQMGRADASNGRFDFANLTGTRFVGANLNNAIFFRAVLVDTDLTLASARGADFSYSIVVGATGIESLNGIESATFHKTIVTPSQRDVILAKRRDEPGMLIVREDLRRKQ